MVRKARLRKKDLKPSQRYADWRSRAARKAWKTRRKRYGKSGLKKDVKKHRKRVAAGEKAHRTRRYNAIKKGFRAVEAIDQLPPEIRDREDIQQIKQDVLLVTGTYQMEDELGDVILSQRGMREQVQFVQDLWERDPAAIEESLRDQLEEVWREDPKSVPEKVQELWLMTWGIWELEDYENIGEIWDIYHEIG